MIPTCITHEHEGLPEWLEHLFAIMCFGVVAHMWLISLNGSKYQPDLAKYSSWVDF